jgi:hypothetical protein
MHRDCLERLYDKEIILPVGDEFTDIGGQDDRDEVTEVPLQVNAYEADTTVLASGR